MSKKINYVSVLEKVFRNEITSLLKQNGYTKHSNTFYKKHDGFIKIINLQKNIHNINFSASCTINIAIHIPTINNKVKDKKIALYPKEYECKLRYRIGELISKIHKKKSFHDKWYYYDQKNSIQITTQEILNDLKQYIFPFLESFESKTDATDFLKGNQKKYFRIAKNEKNAAKKSTSKIQIKIHDDQIYHQRSLEAKRLDAIEQKINKRKSLTKADLIFLYEINSPIKGLAYNKDQRIEQLKRNRNLVKDMCTIFECTPKQIAHNKSEVTTNTKAYVGKLYPGVFKEIGYLNHIYKKFPSSKILKTKITGLEKQTQSLHVFLQNNNITLATSAQKELKNKDIMLSKLNLSFFQVIELNLNDLGFDGLCTTSQLFKKTKQLGLELCPPQVGIHYWKKNRKKTSNEDTTFIGMEPILVGKNLYIFRLSDEMNSLSFYPANPQTSWYDFRLIFCVKA